MITKWYKHFLACMICGAAETVMPATTIANQSRYIAGTVGSSSYPTKNTISLTLSASTSGIAVGTGNTPATDTDHALESQITSGISQAGTTGQTVSVDSNGNPLTEYVITIENTGAAAITIKEIGYYQTFRGASAQYSTSLSSMQFLVDRTVLASPVTIEAGGVAAIKYILKTVVNAT